MPGGQRRSAKKKSAGADVRTAKRISLMCELAHIYRPAFDLLSPAWVDGAPIGSCFAPNHSKQGFRHGRGMQARMMGAEDAGFIG
jgi:hypothetical protein